MGPTRLVGLGAWTPEGMGCNCGSGPSRAIGQDAEQAAKSGLTAAGWTFLIAAIFIVPAAAWVLWKERREAAA